MELGGWRRGLFAFAAIVGCSRPPADVDPTSASAPTAPAARSSGARRLVPEKIVAGPIELGPLDVVSGQEFGVAIAASPALVVASALLQVEPTTSLDVGGVTTFTLDGGVWSAERELFSSTPRVGSFFGVSVATDGASIAVGAYEDNPGAPGDAGAGLGAAYVFVRDSTGAWTQQQQIDPPAVSGLTLFGGSVAIAGDVLVVTGNLGGTTASPGLYVYHRAASVWTEVTSPIAGLPSGSCQSDGGCPLAFDGSTLIIGAQYGVSGGAVYVASLDATGHGAVVQTIGAMANQQAVGTAVAQWGDELLVSAMTTGATPVGIVSRYVRPPASGATGTFTLAGSLVPTDATAIDEYYGVTVALSATAAIVGDLDTNTDSVGTAYLFERDSPSAAFASTSTLTTPTSQGSSDLGVSAAFVGSTMFVGASQWTPAATGVRTGAVLQYELSGDAGAPDGDASADADATSPDADAATVDADATTIDATTIDAATIDATTIDAANLDAEADAAIADAIAPDVAPHDDAGSAAIATGGLVSCAQDSECSSHHCVDGVCCDTACTGACMSCVLAIAPGRCTPEPFGYDLHHDCNSASCATTCSGAGACAPVTSGAQCAPIRCVDPTHTQGAAFCSSAGAACPTSAGTIDDCTPYRCFDSTGGCLTSCVSSVDCASGFVCALPDGVCIADGASPASGGCAMSGRRRGVGGASGAIGLAIAVVVAARRRRFARD